MDEKKSYLEFLFRNYTEAIRAADQKVFLLVSIALAVAVFVRDDIVTISVFVASVKAIWAQEEDWISLIHHIAAVLSLILTFAGILFGLFVMRPSLKSSRTDMIFWGNVARMRKEVFLGAIDARLASGDQAGLAENVYDLAIIVRRKHRIISSLVLLVILMIFFTLGYIVSDNTLPA